jgi:hypothetical protein
VGQGKTFAAGPATSGQPFVRVSPRDPRYFELTDGRPYIPVGFNLVWAPEPGDHERVVAAMADHGVNYCRIWLDRPPWNIEHARSGHYDAEKAQTLDRFLAVCRGPVDLLAADAVAQLQSFGIRKPVILTETGAVKPKHTGASPLYAQDREGILLHDMLFAPFFAGAAGTGHVWFWRDAVDGPNHWHHFRRFQRAIEGIDPPAEGFEPRRAEHEGLRVYALSGRRTLLAWCRDGQNDWQSEFEAGRPPRELSGVKLDLSELASGRAFAGSSATVYDPWSDLSSAVPIQGTKIKLPAFRRSLVIRATF